MSTTSPVLRGAHVGINWLSILSAGLITTALALLGDHVIQTRYHESVLSFYFYHFVPVGALLVGVAAASGYWIAVAILNARVGKRRVALLAALQVAAYFVGQYVEFRSLHLVYRATGEPVGFWTWFHVTATSYVLEESGRGATPLGPVGYVLRLLEIAAFAGPTALLTAAHINRPYCEHCGRYRKTKPLATIPASAFAGGGTDEPVEDEPSATADEDGVEQTEQSIIDGGRAAFEALMTIAESGDAHTFTEQTASFPPRRISEGLGSRLEIEMHYCPGCLEARVSGRVVVKRPVTSRNEFLPSRPVPITFAEPIAEPKK
jgi:hypothetical protein